MKVTQRLITLLLTLSLLLGYFPAGATVQASEVSSGACGENPTHSYINAVCTACGHNKLSGYPELTLDLLTDVTITQDTANNYRGLVYYVFHCKETDVYRIAASATQDTYVHLYDEDLNQLAYNDDGGERNNFQLDYLMEAGRSYVFGIRFYTTSYTGVIPVTLSKVHSYQSTVITPPTCHTEGVALYTCEHCGSSYHASVATTEHTYDDGKITKPGCETGGYTTFTCTVCGHSYQTSPTNPLGHAYKTDVVNPTCTEVGFLVYTCACGNSYEVEDAAPLGHSYAEGECVRCHVEEPIAHGKCGLTLYWEIDENYTLVIYGRGNMYDYEMCESPWHDYADQITGVAITKRVYSIGSYAFCDLTGLKTLTIPNNVSSIGESALSGCGYLTELTIPFVGAKAYTSSSNAQPFGYIFGQEGYRNCIDVEHINGTYYYIPKNLTTVTVTGGALYGYAFHNCTKLVTINLGNYVSTLEQNVFSGCTNLKHLNITSGLTAINDYTFKNCTSLETVTIGNSVTSIGYEAFYGCTSLQSIELPASLKTISTRAFYNCTSLKQAALPRSLTSIGSEAFRYCSSLESAFIPESVTSLQYRAFASCSSLKEATLPSKLTSMGDYMFYQCSSLESITIPKAMKIVPEYTFYECTSLKSATLSKGVTTISDHAFYGCRNLTDLSMESVAKIETHAFAYCTSLVSVDLPEFLGTLENAVFSDCTALETIVIPENIDQLPDNLFSNCTSLREVTLSPDTKSIGNYAFSNCTALTSIELPESVTTINEGAFYKTGLTSITLNEGMTTLAAYVFYNCDGLTEISIPDRVTAIGNHAFALCDGLTSVTIPQNVTTIGDSAFIECIALANVNMGQNVETIGSYAFAYCDVLTDITIGDKVRTISYGAFADCDGLTSIEIPDNVESMDSRIFNDCDALEEVTIGSGVTSIGYSTFNSCDQLKKVIVGKGVQSIEQDAFGNCYHLYTVVFLGDAPEFDSSAFSWSNALCFYPAGNKTWTEDIFQNYGPYTVVWRAADNQNAPVLTVTGDENDNNRSILSWTAVDDAVEYVIYGCIGSDWNPSNIKKLASTKKTTYTDMDIVPGDAVFYAVAAVDQNEKTSIFSNFCFNRSRIATPVVTAESDPVTGGILLHWEAIKDAYRYNIYRSENENSGYEYLTNIYQSAFTGSYVDTTAKPGTQYFYQITAYHSNGSNAADAEIVSCMAILPQPVLTAEKTASGKVELTWQNIDGAAKYELWRSTDRINWKCINTTTQTSYTDSSVKIGTQYYYKIMAVHETSEANSAFTEAIAWKWQLDTPTAVLGVNDKGQPTLTWSEVAGAVQYEIWRRTDSTNWKKMYTTSKTSYTNSSAEYGVKYYYKVCAVYENTSANSDFTAEQSIIRKLNAPTVTVSNNTDGHILLSWPKVDSAVQYEIWYAESGVGESYISLQGTTTGTSFTVNLPFISDGYIFKVRAIYSSSAGNSEFSQAQYGSMKPSQPTVTVSSAPNNGHIQLRWDHIDRAYYYEVFRSTSKNGKYTSIATLWSSTDFTDSNVEVGQTYYYKVEVVEHYTYSSATSEVVSLTAPLPTPQLTVSTNTSGKPFLSWNSIAGALKYEIQRSVDNSTWKTISTTADASKTTLTNTSAALGVEYYYRVRAIHENTNAASSFSDVKKITSTLKTPAITVSNVTSSGKIKLSWDSIDGAVQYEIRYRDYWTETFTELATTSSTSYTVDLPPNSTGYLFQVRAISSGNVHSAYSTDGIGYVKPAQPVVTTSSDPDTGYITLNWEQLEDVYHYEILRSTSKNGEYTVINTLWYGSHTSHTDYRVIPGQSYYYKVRVTENTGYTTAESKVVSRTADLPRPTLTVGTNASGKPVLRWNAIDGAVKYEIQRSLDRSSWKTISTTDAAKTTLTNTSAEQGTKYYYRIRAIHENTAANSAYSTVESVIVKLKTPTLTISNNEDGEVVLNWSKIDDAVQYEIWYIEEYYHADEEWLYHFSLLDTTSSTSYTHSFDFPTSTCSYKIRAIHRSSDASSEFSQVVSGSRILKQPKVTLSNDPISGCIKLQWNHIDRADYYTIYRSVSKNGNFEEIDNIWSTASVHEYLDCTRVEVGQMYYYKVTANSDDTISSATSKVVSRTADLPQPTLTVKLSASGKPALSWNAIDGAAKYEVWRSVDKTNWSRLSTTTKTALTNTSTDPGVTYYYKVRAVHENTSANSAYTTVENITCKLATPTLTVSNVTSSGKIKLSWNTISGAVKYEIWRSVDNSNWSRLSTTTKTTLNNISVESGVKYYYKVRAIHTDSAANSAYSTVKSITCKLATPTLTASTIASSGKIKLSWDAIDGAVKYEVWRSVDNTNWYRLSTTTKITLTNTSVEPGVTYYYKVRAIHNNSNANSAYTEVKSATAQ